ncbi:50S ribosomal protein L9 [bacterium]|nr:50S ribosomal protein L9 [bacterium]
MQLVLIKDCPKVGKKGDTVNVSDGYGRNFLLARGYAVSATDGRLRTIAKENADKADTERRAKAAAEELAVKLQESPISMKARFGEGGKIFGSITANDIVAAIKDQLGITVDKKIVKIDTPLKSVGEYKITVRLHSQVKATVTINLTEI